MKPRITILGLMGVVLFVAIGAAGLKQAPRLVASLAYTATFALFLGAAIHAGRGKKSFLLGFAVFGGAHHLLAFAVPGQVVSAPTLFTTFIADAMCVGIADGYPGVRLYLQRLTSGQIVRVPIAQIALCIVSILVGIVGGYVATRTPGIGREES